MMINVLVFFILSVVVDNTSAQQKKNILFLAADDMRPDIGIYRDTFRMSSSPEMHTPNLDYLASRSLLLKRAYVQQSFCSPSRTSVLTGRRPDTTHVYDLVHYFRNVGGNFTTIPQFFKEHGYKTIGMGKIFHPGKDASGSDDPISWSEPYYHPQESDEYINNDYSWRAISEDDYNKKPLPDTLLADNAINTLRRVAPMAKNNEQPFFLAVGFYKPHLPFIFPEEYLSYYPRHTIDVPENPRAPVNMPYIAWNKYWELLHYKDIAKLRVSGQPNTSLPDNTVIDLRRAYYSTITYIDYEIGRVLQELKELGLLNNTIVSFWGDHGWHLGELGEWCKHTNFEDAVHAPMMISVPGMTDEGVVTNRLTEFVDLFPTLVEAAGFEPMPLCDEVSTEIMYCREGSSLLPLIEDPTREWTTAAFSQYPRYRKGRIVMGYTARTDRYRYTEWVLFNRKPFYSPNWNDLHGVELYDYESPEGENYNWAGDPRYADVRIALMEILHEGWRNSLPLT